MNNPSLSNRNLFSAPLWKSAFRPFYLFGVIYGLGVMGLWVGVNLGIIDFSPRGYTLSLWHGHEMIFGFSGAVVTGFVLTALPGWAGTKEITGARLAFLLLLWLLGRVAVYSGGVMPPWAVLILDSSLFPAVIFMVLPGLLAAENKHYFALLPILLMLFIGNVIFHLALIDGDLVRAAWAIRVGLLGIMVKFIIAGGFLATVFTGNALRQKNGPELGQIALLEYISALTLTLFIYGALADIPVRVSGMLAFIAAAVQLCRLLRWRTRLILDAPLVLAMHLSYLWFVIALMLFGLADFTDRIGPMVWIHAFTIGALSMMMLSLITRVALRHTGRSLRPARAMLLSFGIMMLCALLRVMVSLEILATGWLPAIALIWLLSFLIYLMLHGHMLLLPSLPRPRGAKGPKGPKGQAAEI